MEFTNFAYGDHDDLSDLIKSEFYHFHHDISCENIPFVDLNDNDPFYGSSLPFPYSCHKLELNVHRYPAEGESSPEIESYLSMRCSSSIPRLLCNLAN